MKFRFFVLLIIVITVFSCARRGRPTGGPIDEDKPIMVKSDPDFGSTHFDEDEIKIYFDEYIKLKDLNSQLIISPPLKYPPVIVPQGSPSKFISIKIQDTLQENTTYTFNFGQSIIDNTEGNILDNFKYIISTGDYIDSLKVSGTVKDAFEFKPDKNIVLMLYPYDETFNDSIIFKEKPMYVGALKDSVNFEISNIKAGDYALIALNDDSKNYKYNAKQDKIGFIPHIISVPTDSVYNIVLFEEILPFRLPKKPIESAKGHILFAYEGIADSMKIRSLSAIDNNFKSFSNFDKVKDTLHYWYRGYEKDSIEFIVENKSFRDSVRVKLREKDIDSLKINFGIRGTLNLRDTLSLLSNTPVIKIDTSKINFLDKDSINVSYTLDLNKSKNELYFNFDKKFDYRYSLQLLPGAVVDFFDVQNDTINTSFTTKRPSSYSSIFLTLKNIEKYPIIVDLINERGEVVANYYAETSHKISFNNIAPSRYKIRIIYDENKNKKWDTGNYLKKIQPEKVYYFRNIIEAKANWEVDETLSK
ncbi:MAG: Ig-like domain-containing protein [Bacteroidota bacterium]